MRYVGGRIRRKSIYLLLAVAVIAVSLSACKVSNIGLPQTSDQEGRGLTSADVSVSQTYEVADEAEEGAEKPSGDNQEQVSEYVLQAQTNWPVSCDGYEISLETSESRTVMILSQEGQRETVKVYPKEERNGTIEVVPVHDILGYSGFCSIERWENGWELRCYYTVEQGVPVCLAESFGWEQADYSVDLDGNGIKELICNCEFGGDGAQRVYAYRILDGIIYRGMIDDSILPENTGMPVNSYSFEYNPECNAIMAVYPEPSSESGYTSVELIPSECMVFQAYNLLDSGVDTSPVIQSGQCQKDDAEQSGLTWTLTENGTLTIAGEGTMGQGWSIDAIETDVPIISVVIEEGVTRIGCKCFADCSTLTRVRLPESLTCIESRAFYRCTSLTSIDLPDNIHEIGNSAFEGCTSLAQVTMGGAESIGYDAFSDTPWGVAQNDLAD